MSTTAQSQAVAPATLRAMLAGMLETLPQQQDASPELLASQRETAIGAVAELRPRDALEAALAVRVIATHRAVMECFRLSAQPDVPPSLHLRQLGKAVTLSRLMDTTLQALFRRQEGPALQPAALPAEAVPAPAPRPAAPVPQASPVPAKAARPQPLQTRPVPPAREAAPSRPAAGAQPALSEETRARLLQELAARSATAALPAAA
jgi:hypothetical protein